MVAAFDRPEIAGHASLTRCQNTHNFFFSHNDEFFIVESDFAARIFPEENAVSNFQPERNYRAVLRLAITYSQDRPFLRPVFAVIGDDYSAMRYIRSLNSSH